MIQANGLARTHRQRFPDDSICLSCRWYSTCKVAHSFRQVVAHVDNPLDYEVKVGVLSCDHYAPPPMANVAAAEIPSYCLLRVVA